MRSVNVRMYACYVCGGTDGERPNTIHDGRSARAGRVRCGAAALRGGARGALRRGGVGAIAGLRKLESALHGGTLSFKRSARF